MKVYISGPVTGTDDYVERFQKAEDEPVSYTHLDVYKRQA